MSIGEFKDTINKIANILLHKLPSSVLFLSYTLRLGAAYNHPMTRHRIMKDIMVSE